MFNLIEKPELLSRVRLGGFELDLKSGELRSVATEVESKVVLREQPFQVLRMLIERAGKIVTREEIKKGLWPNDTIVDFDHSINVAIGILRRALGDSADGPRYIETRRGYRLLVAPEWLGSAKDTPSGGPPRALPPLVERLTGNSEMPAGACHIAGIRGRLEDLQAPVA